MFRSAWASSLIFVKLPSFFVRIFISFFLFVTCIFELIYGQIVAGLATTVNKRSKRRLSARTIDRPSQTYKILYRYKRMYVIYFCIVYEKTLTNVCLTDYTPPRVLWYLYAISFRSSFRPLMIRRSCVF